MEKLYAALLQLGCILFFTTVSINTFSKSSSIIDSNHPLYDIEWLFVKTLVSEPVYNDTYITALPPENSGINESYVIINSNSAGNEFYDLQADTENPDFEGFDLGVFGSSNTLILNGAENKTFKCVPDNILNGWLNYRIYLISEPPSPLPDFNNSIGIDFNTNEGGVVDGCQNQLWRTANANIDLLSGLDSGDYYLEVFTHADGDYNDDNIMDFTVYANDGGANYTATFRVDNPPVANCVPSLTVQLDASGNASITTDDINDGSTDDFEIVSLAIDEDTFDCTNVGTPVTVTLTVTDSLGQTDSCTVDVTVVDNIAPEISLNGSETITIEACADSYTELDATASDNCTIDDVTIGGDTVDTNIVGTYTVTYNVTDASGNDATEVTRTVEVVDTTIPTITLNGANPQIIETCETYTELGATAIDPCFGDMSDSIVIDATTVDTNVVGTYSVTYNVTDASGNDATEVTRTVEVVDTTIPTITLNGANPQIIETCETYSELGATANDPCIGDISNSIVIDASAVDTSVVGIYAVTYNVTDADGNDAMEVIRTVEVVDTTIPTITLNSANPQIIETCETYSELGATANDPCFGDISNSIVIDATAVDTNVVGTYSVTYNVTDADGNDATEVIRTVEVVDTTIPTITLNGANPQIIETCETYSELGATANDPCIGDISNSIVIDATAVDTSVVGIYSVTYNVTDADGNDATEVIRTVEVVDTTIPTITLNGANPQIIETCEAYIELGATANDPCFADISNSIVIDASNVDTNLVGTYTVTYNVIDADGNHADLVTRTINVVDTSLPTITLIGDPTMTIEACATFTDPGATASDGCLTIGAVTVSGTVNTNVVGSYTITYSVTDINGNAATPVTRTVNVVDTTNPTLTLVGSETITIEACATYIEQGATANDSCLSVSAITIGGDIVDTDIVGVYVITYDYTDAHNNSAAQITRTVTVQDTTPPTFTSCPGNVNINNDPGSCGAIFTFANPTATDGCGTATVSRTDTTGLNSGDVFPIGITTLEFTATDASGNETICSFTITVIDNEIPSITCPANFIVPIDADSCTVTSFTLTEPTGTDNCGTITYTNDLATLLTSPLPPGTFYVTWTATDAANNTATCIQEITVVDNQNPTVTAVADISVGTDFGECEATISVSNASFDDNCSSSLTWEMTGAVTDTGTDQVGTYTFPSGTTTITYTNTDGTNTATDSMTVTVTDNENPTITCPANITVPATAGCEATGVNLGTPVTADNCGIATVTNNAPASFPIGNTTVVWTVTDQAGNTATCNQIVTVTDPALSSSISINASTPSPICVGTPVTFTATANNAGSNPNFEWFIGGVSQGAPTAVNQFTTSALAVGNNAVTARLTSGPCATPRTSNTITMRVNPNLPISFTLNGATAVCAGEAANFTITNRVNFGANPTYLWHVNSVSTGITTATFSSSSLNNGDEVSVEVTSSATCATPVPASRSREIAVTPNSTISNPSNRDQIQCINTPITQINFTLTNAIGATVTGLPNGITGSYTSGIFRLTGTPTQSGVFNYTVIPTGCGTATRTGTITVNPSATLTLISPDTYEGLCNSGTPMTPIQFQLNPGDPSPTLTSIGSPTLPSGIGGSYNAATGVYTIQGSTNTVGTFQYRVTTNGCGPAVSFDGLIKVFNGLPTRPSQMNNQNNIANVCDSPQTINLNVPLDPNVEYYTWTFYDINGNVRNGNGFDIVSSPNGNSIDVYVTAPQQWVLLFIPWPYEVEIVAHNPCGSSSVRTGYIEILDAGDAVIEVYTPDDDDGDTDIIYVCEGTSSVTMAGYVGELNYEDWEWDDNGGVNGTSGSFSTTTITTTESVCVRYWPWYLGGACREYVNQTTTITTETVDSEYTLPLNAQGGDIITISLIGDGGTFCTNATDNLEIRILETPTVTITNPDVVCAGDDVIVTGTPNTTVTYTDGTNTATFPIDASGITTFPGLPVGTYTLLSIEYTDITFHGDSADCGFTISGESITINEVPTVFDYQDITICSDDTITLTGASGFGGTNASGLWTTSGDGTFTSSINPNTVYTPGSNDIFNGTATLTFTNNPSDNVCGFVSDSMIVTIREAITINNQPQSETACEGETVTFSVSATGYDLSYQWYHNGNLIGANSNTLTLNTVDTTDNGDYYVTIDSNSSCVTVTSNTVSLNVNNIDITDQPVGAIVCEGAPYTFSVSATGTGLGYQWYFNGFPISGATNATLNLTNVSSANAGTYTVSISGDYCGNEISEIATLNVTIQPTVNITYSQAAYCPTEGSQTVILTGINNAGGIYSSAPGLSINPSTGEINPVASDAGTYIVTYTVSAMGGCSMATDTTTVTIFDALTNVFAGADQTVICGVDTTVTLSAGNPGIGGSGLWTVATQTSGFTFSDATNPESTFTGLSGETYDLTWTVTNAGNCGTVSDFVTIVYNTCGDFIYFNGIDEGSVNLNDHYNLGSEFSIEAWVKREDNSTSNQSILSKRNGNSTASGYDFSINNRRLVFRWNGFSITSSLIIDNLRWYHTAVTYNNNTYRLYVDGKLSNTVTNAVSPNSNNFNTLIGATARTSNTPINYYNGWLDELRIWNKALTIEQIQLMMNQEIENNSGVIGSETGPLVMTGLAWTDLDGYYQMNQSTGDIAGGQLVNNAGGINGTLRNMATPQPESAPLPYMTSGSNTNWDNQDTWLNGDVQMVPNTNGVSWNIVQTDDDVHINRSTTVLGMIVNNNNTLSVINDQPLYVTKYLKIDGILDLVGESQLVQPEGSIVDYAGTGVLERDQKGTGNMFNYNYWGSPVNTSGVTGPRTYALKHILYDGDDPVIWTAPHTFTPTTSPVTLSTRWLYTYNGNANDYDVWNRITETSSIPIGLGFLMKGAGLYGSLDINYTFKGQPNNGLIEIAVAPEGAVVVGNPYPSAIDSWEFYDDNINVLQTGAALQFWEQAPDNASHVLAQYRGRYSYLVKTGAVPAAYAPDEISETGTANKIPGRYIPVGQGFFVTRNSNSGNVVFKNTQRQFETEGTKSVFLRTPEGSPEDVQKRGAVSDLEVDIQRVRLAFTTPEGAVRHLLLGFTPDNSATDGIDYGFEALNGDDFPSDLSFVIEGKKFVIQGVGAFHIDKKYPLDMTLKIAGNVELALTDLENFESPIDVFVHDAVLDTYTKINAVSFQLHLPAGNYTDRFSIVFRPDSTLSTIDQDFKEIQVKYLQKTDEIYVKTPASIDVRQVYLINIAGQAVKSWNMTNMNFGQEFKIPVRDLSEGNYILKVETNTNSYNKKIIIKF